ncbi:MAG: ABC transporter ATP-binding protein [Saprospiraceae bacterium]|nr:ABC transporter ATP-binding protein [Saprospiraceae bacterium]MBK8632775.1 ABC transporter ATP-binding protein [Saprospiraceae bacterium]
MIKAQGITKAYGNLKVLKGVDLEIEMGKIISILGKSGAGKSTLLHILGTLDVPDEGVLSIDGEVLTNMKEKSLAKYRNQNLGFVFQFHHLLDEFTALENVCIPAYIAKTNQKIVERKAKELLDYLGLKDRMDHKPNQLSGGEQQRVAVARALINQPKVVLADEPTGNLDNTSSREMHELFLKLRNDFNQTFVIVTHNEELAQMSNKRYFMVDGKIDSID